MTTQNDWKGITTLEAIHSILLTFVNALDHVKRGTMAEVEVLSKTRLVLNRYFEKRLANARREVIKRIESMPDKDVRPEITVWLEPKEYCLGYNKALQDVLATLREEEGV